MYHIFLETLHKILNNGDYPMIQDHHQEGQEDHDVLQVEVGS